MITSRVALAISGVNKGIWGHRVMPAINSSGSGQISGTDMILKYSFVEDVWLFFLPEALYRLA